MKQLERIVLVQFFLHDASEFDVNGNTAFVGPNGTGKTAMLDAVQIAMLGAHRNYLKFNAQAAGKGPKRSIRDYCLGFFKPEGDKALKVRNRRDQADTYITLVFRDHTTGDVVSAGVALSASVGRPEHDVEGLFVVPGVSLMIGDHVESEGGVDVPLRWADFEQRLRGKAKAAGRTATITDRPETYLRELLFALGARSRNIDQREFLKAFRKSVALRDIENVNDFVRDFLIDAPSIDKNRALQQVEELTRLNNLLAEVKLRIGDLSELQKLYEGIASAHRRVAALDTLEAIYQLEQSTDAVVQAEEEIEEKTAEKQVAAERKLAVEQEQRLKGAEVESLKATLREDANQRDKAAKEQVLASFKQTQQERIKGIRDTISKIGKALQVLAALPLLSSRKSAFDRSWTDLKAAIEALATGQTVSLSGSVSKALELLAAAVPELEQARRAADTKLQLAEKDYQNTQGRVLNLRRGGIELDEDANRAILLLDHHKILATPVCSLVRVSDTAWQPAIEGFLKGNRESLIVTAGREDDAIDVLRKLPERQRLYKARVVQPHHFRSQEWRDSKNELVGTLIVGENETAVSYIRFLFGGMRRVKDTAELRLHSRALTIDGMLSANGSTQAIRLVRPDELMLGRKAGPADETFLKGLLDGASRVLSEAQQAAATIETAYKAWSQIGDPTDLKTRVSEIVTGLTQSFSEINQQAALIDAIDTGHLAEVEQALKLAQARAKKLGDDRDELIEKISKLESALDSAAGRLADQKKICTEMQVAEASRRAHTDYDPILADTLRQEMDVGVDGKERPYSERIADCQVKLKRARERATSTIAHASPKFTSFVDRNSYGLLDERTDWRKALKWIQEEYEHLKGTKLADYEKEAANAKSAAELAFRTDIAVKLRDAIQNMHNNMRDLNGILKTCPTFSNGERYHFDATPASEYKDLYQMIVNAADSFTLGDNDASSTVMKMLETASSSDKERALTPLDDFRLMFNFDLEIKIGDSHAGWLSQRIGPGSTGEHRTPFYVIVGAALAHAYRTDARQGGGAALMLVDEAFDAMDEQNSLAAARFLEGLGLQLLMTGPATEVNKLMPVCTRIYDLTRFDMDIFSEVIHLKESARALMTSDFSSEHPELIDAMEATLLAKSNGPNSPIRT
jgi:uncharacterized protein YPO0396